MPILSIASTKGGPGKTTLAVCLADWLRRAGQTIACLDTDPNRNLVTWIGSVDLPGLTCIAVAEDDIIDAAADAAEQADVVIIDVAGFLARGLLYAIGVAHAVLIPCRPAKGDVIEAGRTQQQVVNAAKLSKRPIPHAAILTQTNRRAAVTAHSRSQLEALGIPVLMTDMPLRTIYQQSWYQGCTPLAMQDTAVRDEIGAVATDVLKLVV